MSRSRRRLLVLGIDAANPDLLLGWARDGTLPALGRLLEEGVCGRSSGLRGFFVGATWPSFGTGCSPARHGVHYGSQLVPGSYRFTSPGESRTIQPASFWSTLAGAGQRVLLMDVPFSRMVPASESVVPVEWGCHDLIGPPRPVPEVAAGILQRVGPHPVAGPCDGARRTPEAVGGFVTALVEGAQRRVRITRELLQAGLWDTVVQVFSESHCAGHQCWHLHDQAHPGYAAGFASNLPGGDPLRRVYRAIDAGIGSILQMAGEATVLVVVPHGMSYWYGAEFLLRPILFRLGVASPPAPPEEPLLRRAAGQVWRRLPGTTRSRIQPLRDRFRGPRATVPVLGVDPASSRCFRVANGLAVGGIRLNLKGREPQGVLEPGLEADGFVERLRGDLLAILDDRTGRPLIRDVVPTSALYRGPCSDQLPDLLVEWADDRATGSTIVGTGLGARVIATSPAIGTVEGVNEYSRSGEHRPDGLFIARGPGIRPPVPERISLLDFAPTIAAMGGVGLEGSEGKVIPELLGS